MSNDRNFMKVMVRNVGKESRLLLETALRSGATNVGKQLLDASIDVNQPSDILFDKVLTALKNGAHAAGQEVMLSGLNRIRAFNSAESAPDSEK
ncbi:hypothetical protein [Paenibacillus planticolens]|uniref:Uncharacterized protein n=1 Tax=Paenibacillus planticolens TaxID=2654976 RepID=A0ABX1ZIQ8_9BACL|nr:hypothetical protein [Paenibacillus planticolens]NOU99725.1 hypothetical protein [Paenibacillus planticolens]